MKTAELASIEFSLQWESTYAIHNDRRFVDKISFWRDVFPENLDIHLSLLRPGESHIESYDAGELVPPFKQERIKTFRRDQLEIDKGAAPYPQIGKYYPQGWAWKVMNCFPKDMTPFRVVDINNKLVVADTNHPLSCYPLTLEARLFEKWQSSKERGGSCNDIAAIVTGNGTGMQVPYYWAAKDHYTPYPFQRMNEDDDCLFYNSPRMVNHLDDAAVKQVEALYSRLLSPDSKILDLMSSWTSHLPKNMENCRVSGLGLNKEELMANRKLTDTVVHDLNNNPLLPYSDNTFDAVICTASIEYLIQPLEVIAEIARVTIPGGIFITTFSDRWFPGKEIGNWADLHHFERLGLILDYYHKSKKFKDLHTESIFDLPRPSTDKYFGKRDTSDPIFAVWGNIKR